MMWLLEQLPHARRALRRQRLQRACTRMDSPVAVLDACGRFRIVNDAFCALLGRDAWHLLSVTHQDVVHAADAAVMPRRRRYVRPDGTAVWVLAGQRPVAAPDDRGTWTLLQVSALAAAPATAPGVTGTVYSHRPSPPPLRSLHHPPAQAMTHGVRVTVTSFVDTTPAYRPLH